MTQFLSSLEVMLDPVFTSNRGNAFLLKESVTAVGENLFSV